MGVVSPSLGLPVADYEHPWDGRLARIRVLDWCKSKVQASPYEKKIDEACARRAFLITRDGEPVYTREHWDLPYVDVIEDRLFIIPRGVKALGSGHGVIAVTKISESDRRTLKGYTCQLYDRVRRTHTQMPECPFSPGKARSSRPAVNASAAQEHFMEPVIITLPTSYGQPVEFRDPDGALIATIAAPIAESYLGAAADDEKRPANCPPCDCDKDEKKSDDDEEPTSYSRTAAAITDERKQLGRYSVPLHPPAQWFLPPTEAPQFEMPLTITADGKVMGHGALWDSCHAGYTDRCVPVPRSAQDYKFFHRGAVQADDGVLLAVGHLTVGGGHAGPDASLKAAAEHYDDASSTVAVVAAYEDRWGIYLAGSLVADTDPEKIAMLLRSPLSGDWRNFEGNLELVAMHGVNVPGFGVDRPRVSVAASGEDRTPNSMIVVGCAQCQDEVDSRIASAASILEGKE